MTSFGNKRRYLATTAKMYFVINVKKWLPNSVVCC